MVSVIIPCYNQGIYLQEAIDSVKSQTYTDWEIIIINDGSDENDSISTLKNISAEGYSVINISKSGVSVARNTGASSSKGDYLLFLDGDDMIHPDYLRLAVSAFEKDRMLDYVYCDIREFEGGTEYRSLGEITLEKVLLSAVTHVSGVIKRDLWERSGGFNPDFLKGWEDWDFLIRITQLNIKSYKIPGAMLLYRIRENSRDKVANQEYRAALEQQIFLANIDTYLKYYKEPITVLREHKEQQDSIIDLKSGIENVYRTYSYRLGAGLLYPFKILSKYLHFKK